MTESDDLKAIALKKGAGNLKKHFFICTGPKCCSEEQGAETWKFVKKTLKEKGLDQGVVFRTKANCLRVCAGGPIGLVYPDGTWYKSLTPENCLKVIEEHLENDRQVDELIILRDPLD